MGEYQEGDRVRIDIPDETDPDFRWHGEHGLVLKVIHDDAGRTSGDVRDSTLYRIGLEDHKVTIDARWRDLRPPLNE